MKPLWLLLLIPHFLLGSITVSPTSIQVGEPITVTFTEEHRTSLAALVAQIEQPLQLVGSEEMSDQLILTLTSWNAGTFPLFFQIKEEEKTYYSEVYRIEVQAPKESVALEMNKYLLGFLPLQGEKQSLLSVENQALVSQNSSASKANPHATSSWTTSLYPLLAVALLGGALYFLVQRLYKRRQSPEEELDPKEEAERSLARLAAKRLPEQGAFDRFFVEVTAIVRRYIERQYGLRAPEQTTEEFLLGLHKKKVFDEPVQIELSHFLSSADLVKFASHAPTIPDCNESLGAAQSFTQK